MKVRLFVEGGGTSKVANSILRRDFRKFIEKAKLTGRNVEVVLCGSRTDALEDFKGAPGDKKIHLLLVDAERPVRTPAANAKPWEHLKQRPDGWSRPGDATDEQCHLMVQAMESWFLADMDALESYYGQGFRKSALPRNPSVEEVPKQDLVRGLRQATRSTSKGTYSKGKHSFEILAELDPAKVRSKSPYAERFLSTLEELCQQ